MSELIDVLIADDHPIFRQGLRQVIEKDRRLKLAAEAGDGEEARRLIETLQPSIAVVDIDMPLRSGLEVVRAASQCHLPTKIILLTMYEDEALLDEALNAGAFAYVLKESAVGDLLKAIHQAIEGKHFVSPGMAHFLVDRLQRTERLKSERPGLQKLTATERQILRLIAEDRTSKEIANGLDISVRTVDTHRQNISGKLGLHGSHSLLKFAYDHKSDL